MFELSRICCMDQNKKLLSELSFVNGKFSMEILDGEIIPVVTKK